MNLNPVLVERRSQAADAHFPASSNEAADLRHVERTVRILVISPGAEIVGGSEGALRDLMEEGRNQQIEWSLLFLKDGPTVASMRALGLTVYVLPARRVRELGHFLNTIRDIIRIIRRGQIDAVLSWQTKAHLYGGPAAMFARRPSFWFQMNSASWKSGIELAAACIPARGILTCSGTVADVQRRHSPFTPVRPVHLAVNLSRFDPAKLPTPAECRKQLGLPSTGPIVGIAGRLQTWKGIHTVLEAMPAVLAQFPDAHCVVVGGPHTLEPDYPALLEATIDRLNLRSAVIMAGAQENVPIWMQAMDVALHASVNEPFGIVVVEGMALAKPMVAADTAGPTEIITDGVNGILSRTGDPGDLASAILKYLGNPQFAARIGEAARQRALQFSAPIFAGNVIDRICELLNVA